LRRAGRLADGWFPQHRPGPKLDEHIALVRAAAEGAGRDPDRLGMEGRVHLGRGVEDAVAQVAQWRALGATHVSIDTMRMPGAAEQAGVDRHLEALAEVAGAIDGQGLRQSTK
jgi:alkanesulfonate monooxygenase SsuD/methylene tetrahydromethanopterin reductase-like flavin-dependent oxidoreductase (luciferase family)